MSNVDPTRVVARRTIRANAERVFAAWTEPLQLVRWWGPAGVECVGAEVDLRVGGAYRIGNRLPNGTVLWIVGVFDVVQPSRELGYSWHIETQVVDAEHVSVRFESRDDGDSTEVIVVHERISSEETRRTHEAGWEGCLAGLSQYLATS